MGHGHDVDRFNHMASTYDRHWLQRVVFEPVQRTVLNLAAESVRRPAAILDVGCGTGRLLRLAEQRFPNARLVGVDAAAEMVKQAQASSPNGGTIRFQQAVAENLPFPDAQFDLVFSTLMFHHWNDQVKGITEVARILTPGGSWLVADVMPTGVIRYAFQLFRARMFLDESRLQTMLSRAALRITTQRRVPGLGGQLNVVAIGR